MHYTPRVHLLIPRHQYFMDFYTDICKTLHISQKALAHSFLSQKNVFFYGSEFHQKIIVNFVIQLSRQKSNRVGKNKCLLLVASEANARKVLAHCTPPYPSPLMSRKYEGQNTNTIKLIISVLLFFKSKLERFKISLLMD